MAKVGPRLVLKSRAEFMSACQQVDPSYSIVQECFPYLARRLLTDRDPRLQVRPTLSDVRFPFSFENTSFSEGHLRVRNGAVFGRSQQH